MPAGSPLSWDMPLGHGEHAAAVGTEHPSPTTGRSRQKPGGELERWKVTEGPSWHLGHAPVGLIELAKWKHPVIVSAVEAGPRPGVEPHHTPKPMFFHFPSVLFPRANSLTPIL